MGIGADWRNGWRAVRERPLVSAVAVVSLALAIGVNTVLFSVWTAVMQHTLPVAHPQQLVEVYNLAPKIPGTGYMPVSHLDYLDYARMPIFQGTYELYQTPVALGTRGTAVQVTADLVSGSYFDVLGEHPAAGSFFHADQAQVDGTGALVVLSHDFFEQHFHGDAAVLGKQITLNGTGFTVLGVAESDFTGTGTLQTPDLWAPLSMHRALLPGKLESYYMARNAQFFDVVGRLRQGVTQAQAAVAVRLMGERIAREYPKTDSVLTATSVPLAETTVDPNQRSTFSLAFTVMLAVVGLVLLIACANIANLLLARAQERRREMAVRQALGASRGQLLRQWMSESLVLGLLASVCGLGVAALAQRALWAHRPAALQTAGIHLTLSTGVLAFTLGLGLATTLLFGLVPGLLGARVDPQMALRGRASEDGRGRRRHGLLVAVEAAFSITVLILAGLFVASLRHLQQARPGFDVAHVATCRFDLSATGFDLTAPGAVARLQAFARTLLERVRREPGVASATLASGTPMAVGAQQRGYQIYGAGQYENAEMKVATVESIMPGSFFRTMGIPLLEGRDFLPTDDEHAPRVMIINQTFAREAWPGQDAIGKRILFHDEPAPTTVIGVARNSTYNSVGEAPVIFAYLPLAQEPTTSLGLTVRSAGSPDAVLAAMRQAVAAVNPGLAITRLESAEAAVKRSLWAQRMGAVLLTLLSALATLLAAIGVYGVAAYDVRQRWRELGIRSALGASRRRLFGSVLRRGLAPVVVGIGCGIAAALSLARLAAALLFGVSVADPSVVVGYAGLFLGIACLALVLPARAATAADPAEVLRETL